MCFYVNILGLTANGVALEKVTGVQPDCLWQQFSDRRFYEPARVNELVQRSSTLEM
ncbi:hypothetical protein SUGI_0403170, partial [Cryptomeria japonica]